MRVLLPSLLLLATACTPTAGDLERQAARDAGARAALDTELAGLVPGKPQVCVNTTDLRDLKAYGATLVYHGTGRDKFVNQTSGGCERVANNDILVTRTSSSRLCRGDIATTVDQSSRSFSGSCGLGEFVRYSRP